MSQTFAPNDVLRGIDAGYALPSSWYTDRELFERERRAVLRRSWHYGAHTGQLATTGDQALCEVGGVPIVLVMGRGGEIRGFVNICRHRAHPVVHEPSNRQTLQCLYHGWTYDLEGCLNRAPRAETELDFDKTQFGLTPVQTATWGPMVWVNLDLEAPPFHEWITGLPKRVEEHGLDINDTVFGFERAWQIEANWKVFLDNAIECYHCPTCHPGLSQVLDMDPATHVIEVGARNWISHEIPFQKVSPEVSGAYPAPLADTEETPLYDFYWIFPTTYFQYRRVGTTVIGFDIGTVEVQAVDRIRFRSIVFAPTDLPRAELDGWQERAEQSQTIPEDVEICKRVQHAHASGVASTGRLLPRSEWLLQHFQRVLVEMMDDEVAA